MRWWWYRCVYRAGNVRPAQNCEHLQLWLALLWRRCTWCERLRPCAVQQPNWCDIKWRRLCAAQWMREAVVRNRNSEYILLSFFPYNSTLLSRTKGVYIYISSTPRSDLRFRHQRQETNYRNTYFIHTCDGRGARFLRHRMGSGIADHI